MAWVLSQSAAARVCGGSAVKAGTGTVERPRPLPFALLVDLVLPLGLPADFAVALALAADAGVHLALALWAVFWPLLHGSAAPANGAMDSAQAAATASAYNFVYFKK
jgi:hypothetical protein